MQRPAALHAGHKKKGGVPSTPPRIRTSSQLAEAPPNDSTHPAVVERLTKDMWATSAVLDTVNAQSMAADDPWKALQHLRTSVEALFVEAEGHRDDTAKTYRPAR